MATKGLIRKGDKGDDIINIQKGLAYLGYKVGDPDGIFGDNTYAAVKKFQADNKLDKDGIYGPKTGQMLSKVYQAKVAEQKKAAKGVKGAPVKGMPVKGMPVKGGPFKSK